MIVRDNNDHDRGSSGCFQMTAAELSLRKSCSMKISMKISRYDINDIMRFVVICRSAPCNSDSKWAKVSKSMLVRTLAWRKSSRGDQGKSTRSEHSGYSNRKATVAL